MTKKIIGVVHNDTNETRRRNELPSETDWGAIEKLIRYLITTRHLKFKIGRSKPPVLTMHSDHNWAREITDEKSMTGNLFKLGNNVIAWISRNHNFVAFSSTEAEFKSVSTAIQEIKGLLNITNGLEGIQQLPKTVWEKSHKTQ